jgi:hypothetical protein
MGMAMMKVVTSAGLNGAPFYAEKNPLACLKAIMWSKKLSFFSFTGKRSS